MSLKLEDYALIGDTHTAALVGRDGSIDWLCLPRFDSGACFAALLGEPGHGRWLLAPSAGGTAHRRAYRASTLVLEQDFETPDGSVRVIDFMPPRHRHPRVVRIVEGLEGTVSMSTELLIRFDYGHTIPWVTSIEHGIRAISGPNKIELITPVALKGRDMQTVGSFTVNAGDRVPFALHWSLSYDDNPRILDPEQMLADTVTLWGMWSGNVTYFDGPWADVAMRSLITLKALTYEPSGGIVAAPTTSLPEELGGVRNWDYRYCWVRDATFTLDALIEAGLIREAEEWMRWLMRTAAGAPDQLQIMYGVGGERQLHELTLDWLPGYESSSPVRIGNDASNQFQLDVYGELMDAVHRCRSHGIDTDPVIWNFQKKLADFVCAHWTEPDEGIWEVRGPPRHFVHSKVMAWVAIDRAIRAVTEHGLEGPVSSWVQTRDAIHADVCTQGWSDKRGAFVQYYGSEYLDASLLLIPLVGFLPAEDPRVRSTVEAIETSLVEGGLVRRYENAEVDALEGREASFLPCSFWLVDCLALIGRREDARRLFERLLGLANDVGLLSEGFDTRLGRLVGNFPQALTHVGLVNSARNLG